MRLVVKRRELEEPGQLQALVIEHIDGVEPDLTVLDSRLLLGQATIDVVGLDARGALVLMAVGVVADEEMLLRAVEAYSWCLEYPEAIRRLYPSAQISASHPPRLMFVVERMPDSFHRKIKQLGFPEVDCVEFRALDVDGTPAVYLDTLARLRRGPVAAGPVPERAVPPVPPAPNGRPTSLKLQKLLGGDRVTPAREPAQVVSLIHRAAPRPETPKAIFSAPAPRLEIAVDRRVVDDPAATVSEPETPRAAFADTPATPLAAAELEPVDELEEANDCPDARFDMDDVVPPALEDADPESVGIDLLPQAAPDALTAPLTPAAPEPTVAPPTESEPELTLAPPTESEPELTLALPTVSEPELTLAPTTTSEPELTLTTAEPELMLASTAPDPLPASELESSLTRATPSDPELLTAVPAERIAPDVIEAEGAETEPVKPGTPSVFARRPAEPAAPSAEPKLSFAHMAKELLSGEKPAPPTEERAPTVSAFSKPGTTKRPRTIAPPPPDPQPIAAGPKLGAAPKRTTPPPAASDPGPAAEATGAPPAAPSGFDGLQFPNDGVLTRQWMEFLNQMAAGK